MKEMRISLPEKRRSLIDNILQEFNLEYRCYIGEKNKGETYVEWSFFLTSNQTNTVLEKLKGVGVGVTYGSIYMVPVDFFLQADTKKASIEASMGANFEEVLFGLRDGAFGTTYVILAILAAILAGYGLATQSDVILIGSMIVAPLLAPIALTSLGLLTPGKEILKAGIITETFGLLITVLSGVFVGFSILVINNFSLGKLGDPLIIDPCVNSQIFIRTRLDPATVVLAIFSGLAAGIIIAKGMNISIVGVAIAASVAPPAANVGILTSIYTTSIINSNILIGIDLITYPLLQPVFLATAFLLLNIFIINITIALVLWALGVASKSRITRRKRRDVLKTNIIWITVLGLAVISLLFFSLGTNYCIS